MKSGKRKADSLLLAMSFLCLVQPHLNSAPIIVTSTADSGPGTLRAALAGAADGDTIDAGGLSGTILLTSGELLVSKSVSIVGPGANNLAVDGNAAGQVFHIGANTQVTISGLTITNGLFSTPYPAEGGAIDNDHATLSLRDCVVVGNSTANGGTGSGVFNDGRGGSAVLTVANCTIKGNNPEGVFNEGSYGSAQASITNCIINANAGGGILNAADYSFGGNATLAIVNSSINGNSDCGIINGYGGSGATTVTITNCTINSNGNSGIFTEGGTLIIAGSTLNDNTAVDGGGIYCYSTSTLEKMTILKSTLSGNRATNGAGGGIYSFCVPPGSSVISLIESTVSGNAVSNGTGGGIYNFAGTLALTNCTVSGNRIAGNGNAAAIYNYGGGVGLASTVTIVNSTLSSNATSPSGPVDGILNVNNYGYAAVTVLNSTLKDTVLDNQRSGSDVATLQIGSTLIDLSFGSFASINNFQGTVLSLGYNLSSDGGGGFLLATGDQINTDPMLGPLQDNGGPTWTHGLLPGSPAIDHGKNFSGARTDQRGGPRIFDDPGISDAAGGDGTDIGAFEFLVSPMLGIAPNYGNVVLSWSTNYFGWTVESTTVLGSSANWATVAGTPIVIGNQYFLGDGPAAGSAFYRLRFH